jgi:hypothetical protein
MLVEGIFDGAGCMILFHEFVDTVVTKGVATAKCYWFLEDIGTQPATH